MEFLNKRRGLAKFSWPHFAWEKRRRRRGDQLLQWYLFPESEAAHGIGQLIQGTDQCENDSRGATRRNESWKVIRIQGRPRGTNFSHAGHYWNHLKLAGCHLCVHIYYHIEPKGLIYPPTPTPTGSNEDNFIVKSFLWRSLVSTMFLYNTGLKNPMSLWNGAAKELSVWFSRKSHNALFVYSVGLIL